MLFNSWVFVFGFLPVAVAGFYLVAGGGRRPNAALGWLLACSLTFYAWHNWRLLALILLSIAFNFLAGRALEAHAGAGRPGRVVLGAAVAVNLVLLGWFKYANFFLDTAARLFAFDAIRLEIVLPLAISFFTFQQIAYLVDVARGEAAERSALRYALFVAFFPHLIAGPLLHHAAILRQFRDPAMFAPDARRFAVGATLFALGLFSKVALADRCARFVEPAFATAAADVPLAWTDAAYGTLGFGFQIYFDFAGYSTMAIGLAALFGVRLPVNFDSPYKATSIIDFWRRWHITLSNFLRDYLYVPLGGNRRGRARRWANLMTTMLLGGLWHGASWNFVAWGGLHGLYLVVNHSWRALRLRRGLAAPVPGGGLAGWAVTFAAVSVAWVFFRAPDFASAWRILATLAGAEGLPLPDGMVARLGIGTPVPAALGSLSEPTLVLASCAFVALLLPNAIEWMGERAPTQTRLAPRTWLARRFAWRPRPGWAVATAVLLTVGLALAAQPNRFIYFEF